MYYMSLSELIFEKFTEKSKHQTHIDVEDLDLSRIDSLSSNIEQVNELSLHKFETDVS